MFRKTGLWVAGLLVSTAVLTSTAAAVWTIPIRISGTQDSAHVPAVAVGSDGVVHAVWAAEEGSATRQIYYSRSTDGGASFSAPLNISQSAYTDAEPVVGVAADQSQQIYVVWERHNPLADPSGAEVILARSTDGGVTWPTSSQQNLSANTGFSGSPFVFVDATTLHAVHVAWTDCAGQEAGTDTNCEVVYRRSSDGGDTFSSQLNASNNALPNDQPSIVADATATHLAWQGDLKVLYSRSTDGGASFAVARRLSTSSDSETESSVVLDGSARLHVAWESAAATGGGDIMWSRSTDAGVTFGSPASRSGNPTTLSQAPHIGASGNQVTLLWVELTDGGVQAYSAKSSNGGNSWGQPNTLGNPSPTAQEPNAFVRSGVSYGVWEDNSQIYFSKE